MNHRLRVRVCRRCLEYAASRGAHPIGTPYLLFTHQMATPAGVLFLRFEPGNVAPSVFARFACPPLATALGIGCNPYTGKWNHHLIDHDPAAAIAEFATALDSALGRDTDHARSGDLRGWGLPETSARAARRGPGHAAGPRQPVHGAGTRSLVRDVPGVRLPRQF